MKVKVTKKIWYNETVYDPEIEGEDIIIEYPCEDTDNLPSWAEPVEIASKKAAKKTDEGEGKKNASKIKVNELPLAEKNMLLQEAEKVGIKGNQILGWGADTLREKIAAKKTDEGEE